MFPPAPVRLWRSSKRKVVSGTKFACQGVSKGAHSAYILAVDLKTGKDSPHTTPGVVEPLSVDDVLSSSELRFPWEVVEPLSVDDVLSSSELRFLWDDSKIDKQASFRSKVVQRIANSIRTRVARIRDRVRNRSRSAKNAMVRRVSSLRASKK